ncbi:MAG: restriction endonuclease, partial [Anaerolineales bacterium]
MNQEEFEQILDIVCQKLTDEANRKVFQKAEQFENRVREVLRESVKNDSSISINTTPHPQAFPDIAVGRFGVEVKFTLSDTWRSVANSVLETNRIESVEK